MKDYAKYFETKEQWNRDLKRINNLIDRWSLVVIAILALIILSK